jgi:hypothetical protein
LIPHTSSVSAICDPLARFTQIRRNHPRAFPFAAQFRRLCRYTSTSVGATSHHLIIHHLLVLVSYSPRPFIEIDGSANPLICYYINVSVYASRADERIEVGTFAEVHSSEERVVVRRKVEQVLHS